MSQNQRPSRAASTLLVTLWCLFTANSLLAQYVAGDTAHHYFLCFPEDIQTYCPDDPSIPGVTFGEYACDLMAVSTQDVFFAASVDSACYKVFRTYRVINWCEYDGEASPTVVSRDWDNWNGTNPGRCDHPRPDGNDEPGDEGMCVIVKRDFDDLLPDTVWYDADNNPYNSFPDNPATAATEGYWWRVISGGNDPAYESYYEGDCSTWAYDDNQTDSDISGNVSPDDADRRYGSFGYWEYTQHIVVYHDVPPGLSLNTLDTFCTRSDACETEAVVSLQVESLCTGPNDWSIEAFLTSEGASQAREVTGLLQGELPNLQYRERLALGSYTLNVFVNDGCGNETEKEVSFTVADCVGPAPICLDEISVELMPDESTGGGMAAIWATDFVASPIFDCTGQDASEMDAAGRPLVTDYSINLPGEESLRDQTGITVTCDDTLGIDSIEIHAWDETGNHDYCLVRLDVQDNNNSCGGSEMDIAGRIRTNRGTPIPDVDIYVSQDDGSEEMMQRTREDGRFAFSLSGGATPLQVRPVKYSDPFAGITILDAVKLQRHLLNIKKLETPYELLAADLDQSGHLSVGDMIRLQKILLGWYAEWPEGAPWRFLDARFRFARPDAPWAEYAPQSIDLATVFDVDKLEFVAIKLGDLNNSAMDQETAGTLRSAVAETPIQFHNEFLPQGETKRIFFTITEPTLEGLYARINWDPNIARLEPDRQPTGPEYRLDSDGGALSMMYLRLPENPESLTWSVRVTAKKGTWLSDLFSLDASQPATAITGDLSASKLFLSPIDPEVPVSWSARLLDGIMEGRAGIRLQMSGNRKMTVRWVDVTGRILAQSDLAFTAGVNHLAVPAAVASYPRGLVWAQLTDEQGNQQVITVPILR
jgi:hypothetical protein